jgi:hypothetical protein
MLATGHASLELWDLQFLRVTDKYEVRPSSITTSPEAIHIFNGFWEQNMV